MGTESQTRSVRLFPSLRLAKPISTPLSILDATCARFSDTGAIWLFNGHPKQVDDEFVDQLKTAFISTLDGFPQWAGQLHWAPFRPEGPHTGRFNRAMITYGSKADPGVEWNAVRHEYTIESIIPCSASLSSGIWTGDAFPQSDLISPTKPALHNLKDFDGLPSVLVQVNLFACGGYGIGIKVAHPLADAQSMMVFVHQWAANSRGIFGSPSASLFDSPFFDPAQLDSRAAGDIDSVSADQGIVDSARSMPLNRFSWWDTDAPGYSPWFVASTKNSIPPAEVLAKTALSLSIMAPWSTLDLTRPVSWGLLHFTGQELLDLQRVARAGAPEGRQISRTDALLAHLFRLITRARAYSHSPEDEVFINISIDARRRVSPPLPETFIGSPLLMAHVRELASAVRDASIGELALKLRETLKLFTPDKMAAVLHDAAYEVSPQRLWLGFMGSLHIIATSWQRLHLYEVDFQGSGKRPAYVHAVMPKCDGILVILDPIVPDDGVDIALHLDSEAWSHFREEFNRERLALD
ncbi:transferase family protein [Xylariales sp. AK1849]|nr:transferase family protein [Xylariales sp. AK1849]